MSEVPTKCSGNGSESSDDSTSELIWLFVGGFLLMVVWTRLVKHVGFLAAIGTVFLLAAGTYMIIFAFFLRKSKRSFRIPLPDSTRIFVSSILLLTVTIGLTDHGLFKAMGTAALCAIGSYALSFVFFRRKISESFRIRVNRGLRYFVPIPIAFFVLPTLELGFLEEIGAIVLLYLGAYAVTLIFFSTRVDVPQAATDTEGPSEST